MISYGEEPALEPLIEALYLAVSAPDQWDEVLSRTLTLFDAEEVILRLADQPPIVRRRGDGARLLPRGADSIVISHDIGSLVALTLAVRREAPPFGHEDRIRADQLRPHLGQVGKAMQAQSGFRRHLNALSVLHDLALACFVFDSAGQVIFRNEAGDRLIGGNRPLAVVDGHLFLQDRAAQAVLDAGVAAGKAVEFPIEADGMTMQAMVRPLGQSDGGLGLQAVLFVVEPRIDIPGPEGADRLVELYGFTTAEAEIALDLIRGFTSKEIAKRRESSHHTVRTQIKHVLEKVGVSSQRDLFRLLGLFEA